MGLSSFGSGAEAASVLLLLLAIVRRAADAPRRSVAGCAALLMTAGDGASAPIGVASRHSTTTTVIRSVDDDLKMCGCVWFGAGECEVRTYSERGVEAGREKKHSWPPSRRALQSNRMTNLRPPRK